MKDLWTVFVDGIISGMAMFGSIAVTTISFGVFVVVWSIAYVVCRVMFVVTELIDFRFGVEDWHPEAQLAGYEPRTWLNAISDTYNHWYNVYLSHLKKILK